MKYPLIAAKIYDKEWLIVPSVLRSVHTQFQNLISGEKTARITDDDLLDDPELPSEVGNVSVVPVCGVLGKHLTTLEMKCGGCSVDKLTEQIQAADLNPRTEKILLKFRSPGGMVLGTPECANVIANCNKETIAFCDDQCCSGALWLASACAQFYCTESAYIGSCGVYSLYMDYTKQMEMEGVKANPISSGEFKLAGAYFKEMTEAERAMFQARTNSIHEKFIAAVSENHPSVDRANLQGQIFLGDEAAQVGLVDGCVEDLNELLKMLR